MDAIAAPLYVKTFTQDHHTVIAPRQGLYEITDDIKAWTTAQTVTTGLLTLYLRCLSK